MSDDFDAAIKAAGVQPSIKSSPDDFDSALNALKSAQATVASAPSGDVNGGVSGGFMQGIKDPLNAGAQLVDYGIKKLLPDSVNQTMNDANNWLYKSTNGLVGYSTDNFNQALNKQNADYEDARALAGRKGFDWARLAGSIPSAVALTAATGAPTGMVGAVKIGATSAMLSTPLYGDTQQDFGQNKLIQGGWGALGGMTGQVISNVMGPALDKATAAMRQKIGGPMLNDSVATNSAKQTIDQAISSKGIDPSTLHPDTLDMFLPTIKSALQTGGTVDPKTLANLVEAQSLPIPIDMMAGQASRDPMQFAFEQNNRGLLIPGIGKPITDRLVDQDSKLVSNLDVMGAGGAPSPIDTSRAIIQRIQNFDAAAKSQVTNAYNAFKSSTGKSLDVPLEGLAQDYASTVADFGDKIPSAVRAKFEALGVNTGTQKQVFSIDDAEKLIKTINANYDPKNYAESKALNTLRNSVEGAIQNTAADSGLAGEAAQLASNARKLASQRFQLMDNIPSYKEAVNGAEPDKFFQKYLLNGDVSSIKNTMGLLGPEEQNAVRSTMIDHLKTLAIGTKANDDNGVFGQATYNRFVQNPLNQEKLQAVLSPNQFEGVTKLGRVAENLKQAPAHSAVNYSNTASAANNNNILSNGSTGLNATVNAVKGALGFSGFHTAASLLDFAQSGVKKGMESAGMQKAVMDSLTPKAVIPPQAARNALLNFVPAVAGNLMGRPSSGQ